jgi:hypothetical protein
VRSEQLLTRSRIPHFLCNPWVEICNLLGFYVVYNGSSIPPFYVVYNGSSIPPFQEEVSVPSTRVEQSNAVDINVTIKRDELLNLWLRWAEN